MRARDAFHRILRSFGVDLVRYNAVNFTGLRRIEELRRRSIGLVLDVGANTGQFAAALRDQGYRGRIVSFEPIGEAFAALQRAAAEDPQWEVVHAALSDRSGEVTLNVAANSWSSSLLAVTDRHVASAPASRLSSIELVGARPLDDLHGHLFHGERAYLKLDVQGSELAVLRGAVRTIADVEVVEAELSLVELYDGQPLLTDVVAFLDEHRFALVQLEPEFTDPETGAILQMNGIFVRVPAP